MTKTRKIGIRFLVALMAVGATIGLTQCKQPSAPDVDMNEPPTVVIDSHVDGELVSGIVNVTGTAADDAGVSEVAVSFNGGSTYNTATGTGAWQITLDTTAQPDGNLYIKVEVTDSGGFRAYAFLTLIVDNAGPGVLIISPLDNQKVSGHVAIVGLGAKVDSVELRVDGGSYQTVTGNYAWYEIWDTTLVLEGAHTIDVRPIRSGIPGSVETIAIVVDQTVPNVTFTSPAVGAYIKGTPSVTGTSSDNNGVTRVEVSTNGGLNYTTATGTTNWSKDVDTTVLPDGARVLYSRATDVTGLLGMASIPVTVDNNAPTVSIESHFSGDLVSGVVHLNGTADDTVGLDTIEVKFGPVSYQPADGTNSWNYDFNTVSIPNGSYNVYVRATDFSGNYSETSMTVVVDQSFPQVNTINIADGDYLRGTKALSGTVSDGDGTADIATVEVKVGGGAYQPAVHTTGSWTFNLDTMAHLPDGNKTVTVKVTDVVGGFTTLGRNVVFDNGVPAVAVSSPLDLGQVAGTVLLVGTVTDSISPIDTLSLTIDGVIQAPAPTRNGSFWSFSWDTDAPPQALGNHTLQITATDMAGNSQSDSITVDKTLTVPSIVIGSHNGGDFVKSTITLSGTSAPGSGSVTSVDVQVDAGAPVTATGTTSWSTDVDTTAVTDGTHVIYVTVTNDGFLTTTTQITLTVDNTLPTLSITYPTALNTGANALYGTLDIDGSASDVNLDYVEIDVDGGGYAMATGASSFTQTWDTTTVTGVAKDIVVITARAVDLAGNEGTTQVTVDVHPHIDSLSVYSSSIGETITVYGDNFAPTSAITFDGVAATALTWITSQEYDVTIPAGATSGDVVVTTNGVASNGVHLNIWAIDQASTGGSDIYPSLVLDGGDNIYMGFIRGGGTKTVGFTKYNATLETWTEATSTWSGDQRLDYNTGGGGAPIYASVGVSGTNVYMSYHHSKSGELRIVKSVDGGVTFAAPVTVVAGGQYPSLAVYYDGGSGQDHLIIAYYDAAAQDLVVARSTDSGATFDTPEVIDSAGDVGSYASLDLDGSNNPRIGYYDASSRALKYAYWDVLSLLWRIKTIDSSLAGEYASATVAADGSTHLAYYDGSSGDLNYATATSPSASFSLAAPDTAGITGWYTSIATDSLSAPHVAYYDFTYGQIRYAEKTTGSWNTMTVPETAGISQSFTTIGVDSANIQRVGYATGSGLRVARYLP